MVTQSGRSSQHLLREFIEKVLRERQLGWVESLCFHRVKLFDIRSRQYYSVPAVQEQLLHLFRACPDFECEILEELVDLHTKSGAAALLQLKTADRQHTALIMVRTAAQRITTIRFILDFNGSHTKLNSFPAAEVEVASVPNKIYMMYEHLRESGNYPLLENYLYALAGLPRSEQAVPIESLQDPQICSIPGSVYLADIMGKRIESDTYAYMLAWYKGLLVPHGNVTVGGGSYIELNAGGLLRDIRIYDDSPLVRPEPEEPYEQNQS